MNSVYLRANIAVIKILVKLLIQDYLHIPFKKTINEKYWLLIAAGMLRPFKKIKSPMYFMGADVFANLKARACFRHV